MPALLGSDALIPVRMEEVESIFSAMSVDPIEARESERHHEASAEQLMPCFRKSTLAHQAPWPYRISTTTTIIDISYNSTSVLSHHRFQLGIPCDGLS